MDAFCSPGMEVWTHPEPPIGVCGLPTCSLLLFDGDPYLQMYFLVCVQLCNGCPKEAHVVNWEEAMTKAAHQSGAAVQHREPPSLV